MWSNPSFRTVPLAMPTSPDLFRIPN
jgi:hypothetical protein